SDRVDEVLAVAGDPAEPEADALAGVGDLPKAALARVRHAAAEDVVELERRELLVQRPERVRAGVEALAAEREPHGGHGVPVAGEVGRAARLLWQLHLAAVRERQDVHPVAAAPAGREPGDERAVLRERDEGAGGGRVAR